MVEPPKETSPTTSDDNTGSTNVQLWCSVDVKLVKVEAFQLVALSTAEYSLPK